MGDGCDFARWEEDQKRDQSKQLRVECALGAQVGLAAWDIDHGQPDNPDLFECREDYYHFPCGMCKHRANEPELRCVGCRHYCP